MRSIVDSIFNPVLGWLSAVIAKLSLLSVPLARPLDLSRYFGYFAILGPYWQTLISTVCVLSFIYMVVYLIMANLGLIIKFKNAVKWW